jgi:hypothetical protein
MNARRVFPASCDEDAIAMMDHESFSESVKLLRQHYCSDADIDPCYRAR